MKLLLIEDQKSVVALFSKLANKTGVIDHIMPVSSEAEFNKISKKELKTFNVIVMDLLLDTQIPLRADRVSTKVTFSGFTLMKNIRDTYPKINIAVLTQFTHEQTILSCFRSGARCFMSKHEINSDELVENLKAVNRGDLCIDPSFSPSCQNKIIAYNDPYLTTLTDHELDLLELTISGASTDDIMELLEFKMPNSIYNKIAKMVKSTGFTKRAELTAYAVSIGMKPLIPLPSGYGRQW